MDDGISLQSILKRLREKDWKFKACVSHRVSLWLAWSPKGKKAGVVAHLYTSCLPCKRLQVQYWGCRTARSGGGRRRRKREKGRDEKRGGKRKEGTANLKSWDPCSALLNKMPGLFGKLSGNVTWVSVTWNGLCLSFMVFAVCLMS